MSDTPFVTDFADVETMLREVVVDDVADIETLLMFLFVRPVQVVEVWDHVAEAMVLEAVIDGASERIGSTHEFPLSVVGLARACAETVGELGPYLRDGFVLEEMAPDVSSMDVSELVAALQQALGQVRFFNLMDAGD